LEEIHHEVTGEEAADEEKRVHKEISMRQEQVIEVPQLKNLDR